MIELKNVSKFYNDNKIVTVGLRNVSLKLNKGEFVAITGDSGSGKSTLLNVISSIDGYDEGEILFYGNETFYFNQNDSDTFRKNNVSFIFQKYNIVDSYTVLQNVMLPLLIKGMTDADAEREAMSIISRVGLGNRVRNKGTELSGGEKQRCVIARALATDAPILACDEPTGNLDSKTSAEIIKLIKEVASDKLVLVVTHDYDSIKDVCTRKIKLSDGELVEDITFAEGVEENDRKLDLDDSRPAKKTLFKLASLNILSTPKKTVFATLVFSFVSCILLLLSLLMIKTSYEENYTYSSVYNIISEDRLVIYSSDHDSLDMDALAPLIAGTEYYENAFYEEIRGAIRIGSSDSNIIGFQSTLTFHDMDFDLVTGSEEPTADEIVLIMPDYYFTSYYTSYIGEEVVIVTETGDNVSIPIGKLGGIGISEEINNPCIICSKDNTGVANIILNNRVTLSYENEEIKNGRIRVSIDEELERSYFEIPKEFEGDIKFTFNLVGIYDVTYDLDFVYTEQATRPTFHVGKDYFDGTVSPKFDGVKEIYLYTDDVRGLSSKVEKLGYNVSIPGRVNNSEGASLITLYMLMLVTVMALVIMFYISFAIIQRIYMTKMKDYSIFRTLGLVSTDLKKVLHIEVAAITVVSIVLGALLTNVIIIITKIDLYKYVSLAIMLFYVIAMLIFGIATSVRLNTKIFKNSVYQSLKEGGQ